MGDLVLPPITWIVGDMSTGMLDIRPLRPDEMIPRGPVVQLCRYALNGPAKVQLQLYKALHRQYGDRMSNGALKYLNDEIKALEEICAGKEND